MKKIENIKLQIELFNISNPELSKANTLNQEGASIFLDCSPNTLKNYRTEGIGPSYSQPKESGSRVFYTKVALAEWLIDTSLVMA